MKTHKLSLFATTLVAAGLLCGTASAAPSTGAFQTVPGAVYIGDAPGYPTSRGEAAEKLAQMGIRDVEPDSWYAGAVVVLAQVGALTPDASGDFDPNAGLTDADGIAAFARITGVALRTDGAEEAVQKARAAHLLPDNMSTTGEMSRMDSARLLALALGITAEPVYFPSACYFSDTETLTPEERGLLQKMYELGVFQGYPDHTFKPDQTLTRAEMAVLINRYLGATSH